MQFVNEMGEVDYVRPLVENRVIKLKAVSDVKVEYSALPKLNSSRLIHDYVRPVFEETEQMNLVEHFYLVMLNNALKPIGVAQIGQGGLTATVADPRTIFQYALLSNAVYIVLAHNHPSGSLAPSEPDKTLTRKIKQLGEFHEIHLLDHLILVPENGYFSFSDAGILE